MSFVICVVTSSFGIVASDGRGRNENNEIVAENFRKFCKINPDVIIAFGGDGTIAHLLMHDFNNRFNHESLHFERIVSLFTSYVNQILTDPELLKKINVQFMILGMDTKNTPRIETVSIVDNIMTCGDSYNYSFAVATASSKMIADGTQIVYRKLDEYGKDIPKALYEAIQEVANVDPSVNKNVSFDYIGKPPSDILQSLLILRSHDHQA